MPVTLSSANARSVVQVDFKGVVTRCSCESRGLDFRDVHTSDGNGGYEPCPQPLAVEDRGTIAYYHRNPLRRLVWNTKHRLGVRQ